MSKETHDTSDKNMPSRSSEITLDQGGVPSDLRTRAEKYLEGRLFRRDTISGLSRKEIKRLIHDLQAHQIELEMKQEELRVTRLKLQELKDKYVDLYDFAPVGYVTMNEHGVITEANLTCAALLDVNREKIIGRRFSEFIARADLDVYYFHWRRLEETGLAEDCDIELARNDGSLVSARLQTVPFRDPDSGSVTYRTTITDITEHKKADEALRESEERHRAIFNNAGIGIDIVDRQGRFEHVNPALSDMLGYTEEELRNLTIAEVTHPDDIEPSRGMLEEFSQGKIGSYRLEKRYLTKNGTVIWADVSVSAMHDAEGGHTRNIGVISDITARKDAEMALQDSEQKHRHLATAVEQAAEGILITDARGIVQYVNPAYAGITGYDVEEILGRNPSILQSGRHDESFYKEMWATITSGRTWSGHMINKRKDGALFEEDATISPVLNASGNIINYVAVKRDVTNEMALQRELLHAQKMEAVGTLAGGIAHDFNNLLQVVQGYSELLLTEEDTPDPVRGDLEKINMAARNGAGLVQRLLTFSRRTQIEPRPLNLNHRITEIRQILDRTIPRMIEIQLILDDTLAAANVDPAQVDQVLMNLALNAKDAMPDGGKLIIETENVTLDKDYCLIHPGAKPGHYVLLKVSDTGCGMDKETLEHIFQPFFTTKGVGVGTGLGLAMVYGSVKQHGGHIVCYSEPGYGATFKIYFPSLRVDSDPGIAGPPAMPAGGKETILLVEDDKLVCELGEKILRQAGYTALTAPNGKIALELYKSKYREIALVILDLIMPEMGGKECLEEILQLDPRARIIVASGYSVNGPTKQAIEKGARGFVGKPYDVRQMLQTIRDVLDAE